MKSLRGYAFIIAATTFWGVSATIAKFLFSERHVDTLVLVQMRMTLSCIVLLLVFILFRREYLRIRLRDFYRFAMLGILGGAGSNFTYYFTIERTNVATAILLQYMAPMLVLIYAAVSRDERVTLTKGIASFVSILGCFLAIGGISMAVFRISTMGLVTGIASAFCWAFTTVWLRRLLKDYNTWTCLVYAFISASCFWMFFNPPWTIAAAGYPAETWALFFGFAMISILIPHSLYFQGVNHLTASRAIVTATFEPVVAILSAFVLIGERLAPVQLVGAAFVIAAVVILQLKQDTPPAAASPDVVE